MYVPHDQNNNPVGRVSWYRSLDLVTSEDVTDEYYFRELHTSVLVTSGGLAGLYKDLYVLSILDISSSDNGYYWCQVVANGICLSSSFYVSISVSTASAEDALRCSSLASVDYHDDPLCATVADCDKTVDHNTVSFSTLSPTSSIRSSTVSYGVSHKLKSFTNLTMVTSSVLPPRLSDPSSSTPYPTDSTSSALTYSLSSIIVLLVLSLLFTITAFVVVCKRKEKRKCKSCNSKF